MFSALSVLWGCLSVCLSRAGRGVSQAAGHEPRAGDLRGRGYLAEDRGPLFQSCPTMAKRETEISRETLEGGSPSL